MSAESLPDLARAGRLYPSIILYGGTFDERRAEAMGIARALLCAADARGEEGCNCVHCRRLAWPGDSESFHPDFRVLDRDLRTATSVDAVRQMLRVAQLSPFEARGQVFVVLHADTLTDEAANALLKVLEEPPSSAPRHFLLLAPSATSLLPTLRSRSLASYVGAGSELDRQRAAELAEKLEPALAGFCDSGEDVYLLAAADLLHDAADWQDLRSSEPWSLAAATMLELHRRGRLPQELRSRLLDLATELLRAPEIRQRAVPAPRILDGLFARCLLGEG